MIKPVGYAYSGDVELLEADEFQFTAINRELEG
jgi:hypothetical protein